jgi:hypothetical protein
MTTMSLPALSGRFAIASVAQSAAPDDIPSSDPYSRAAFFAVVPASSLVTCTTSSMSPLEELRNKPGTNSLNFMSTRLAAGKHEGISGSTAIALKEGFLYLIICVTPVIVPQVPTPATKTSALPPVSFQISCAAVLLCMSTFASFLNWRGMNVFSCCFVSSSAFAIAPFPLLPSVRTNSAQKF